MVHYLISTEEHDLVIIGGGVAGYVGAIKAGQEGLKVLERPLRGLQHIELALGCLYRKADHARWYMPKCRLHPFQVVAEQLATIPHDHARFEEARDRRGRA